MLNPSVSPEEVRLAALRRYHILDTPPDPAFDRLTELAARLFAVPYAAINFVDADEVQFKSSFGLSLKTIPRAGSFCECTLAQGGRVRVRGRRSRTRVSGTTFSSPARPFCVSMRAPPCAPRTAFPSASCAWRTPRRALSPEDLRASLVSLAAFVMREVELHQALHRLEAEASADKVAEAGAAYAAERRGLPPVYLRLQKAYNELEAWAGQRTAALERANRALEHEVAERERAEAALRAARAELEDRIARAHRRPGTRQPGVAAAGRRAAGGGKAAGGESAALPLAVRAEPGRRLLVQPRGAVPQRQRGLRGPERLPDRRNCCKCRSGRWSSRNTWSARWRCSRRRWRARRSTTRSPSHTRTAGGSRSASARCRF